MGVLYLGRSMGKLELITKFRMEQENEHLQAYKKMFPHAKPNIFQMDLIEGFITDANAWQKTLEFWAGNDYRPQSVQKMIEYYKGVINGTNRSSNKRTDADVIAESADFYENYPA
jgi:hypothetical protein